MKTKQISIVLFVFIALCTASYGQDKTVFNPELLDMGDGNILSSTLNASGDYVFQEFEVEVKRAGKYYLAAWVNGGMDLNGEKLTYSVLVNSDKEEHQIRAEKGHPHAVDFGEKMFDLTSGVNRIAFKTKKPLCPNVEFVKVSQDDQNRQISSEKYDQFIAEISNHKKAATSPSSASGIKYKLLNPEGNYAHEMDVYFEYSYYTTLFLDEDEDYIFETSNETSGTDPVIHVFSMYGIGPDYSWTDDNGAPAPDDVNARLEVSIGLEAGYYYVFIRKAGTSDEGTCSLSVTEGTTSFFSANNCAVWGSRIECEETIEETLNWFTADLNQTGDSHIWLENQSSPGEIMAYNDDWTVSSDFAWGNNSRIRKSNVPYNIEAIIVSSHSSYNPEGTCDLYMNCMNYPGHSQFPNLKSDDAILSAPIDGEYNCFGWSGGRYWAKDHPWDEGSPWYDEDGILASFDNYYANKDKNGNYCPRYPLGGAMNFIQAGTGGVALWGVDVESIDHASVKKPANDHPHGYDWESKAGGSYRFFHPKDALEDSMGYGSILIYYRWDEDNPYSYPPSKKSTASLEIEELAIEKQVLMKNMIQTYPDQARFEEIYESWKDTWDDPELVHHSNPRMFAKSKQYTTLLEYCQNRGKEVWPLVFDKYIDGEELNMLLIGVLTFKDYLWMMDEVKQQQSEKVKNMNIIPSQRANYINYIAALIGELEKEKQRKIHSDVLTLDDNQSINVYPNPVKNDLKIEVVGLQESEALISICDLTGKTLKSVSIKVQGDFTHSINMEDISDGTYLCKIEIGNLIHTTRINVIK